LIAPRSAIQSRRGSIDGIFPWLLACLFGVGGAPGLLALSIVRRRPIRRGTARELFRLELLPFRALRFIPSGLVGDYVIWMVVGLAGLSAFIGLAR
jgi:hypothetical protein